MMYSLRNICSLLLVCFVLSSCLASQSPQDEKQIQEKAPSPDGKSTDEKGPTNDADASDHSPKEAHLGELTPTEKRESPFVEKDASEFSARESIGKEHPDGPKPCLILLPRVVYFAFEAPSCLHGGVAQLYNFCDEKVHIKSWNSTLKDIDITGQKEVLPGKRTSLHLTLQKSGARGKLFVKTTHGDLEIDLLSEAADSTFVEDKFTQKEISDIKFDMLLLLSEHKSMVGLEKNVEGGLLVYFNYFLRLNTFNYQLARLLDIKNRWGSLHHPEPIIQGQSRESLKKIERKLKISPTEDSENTLLKSLLLGLAPQKIQDKSNPISFVLDNKADLYLMIASGQDDKSNEKVAFYRDYVELLKHDKKVPRVHIHTLSGGEKGCQDGTKKASMSPRLIEFASESGFIQDSICSIPTLMQLAWVKSPSGFYRQFKLSEIPNIKTVKLLINEKEIAQKAKNGHTQWAVKGNRIHITVPTIPDDKIIIKYKHICSQ